MKNCLLDTAIIQQNWGYIRIRDIIYEQDSDSALVSYLFSLLSKKQFSLVANDLQWSKFGIKLNVAMSFATELFMHGSYKGLKLYNRDILHNLLDFIATKYPIGFHEYIIHLIEDEKTEIVEQWFNYLPSLKTTIKDYLYNFLLKNNTEKLDAINHLFCKDDTYKRKYLYKNAEIPYRYLKSINYNRMLIQDPILQQHMNFLYIEKENIKQDFHHAVLNYYADLDLILKRIAGVKVKWPTKFEMALLSNDYIFLYFIKNQCNNKNLDAIDNTLDMRKHIISKAMSNKKNDKYKDTLYSTLITDINNPIVSELAPWLFRISKKLKIHVIKNLNKVVIKDLKTFESLISDHNISVINLPFFEESFIYHSLLGKIFYIKDFMTKDDVKAPYNDVFMGLAVAMLEQTFRKNISIAFTEFSSSVWPKMILSNPKVSDIRMKIMKKYALSCTILTHPLNNCSAFYKRKYREAFYIMMRDERLNYNEKYTFDQYLKDFQKEYSIKNRDIFQEYLTNLFCAIHKFFMKRIVNLSVDPFLDFAKLLEPHDNYTLYTHKDFKWIFTSSLCCNLDNVSKNVVYEDLYISNSLHTSLERTISRINEGKTDIML